MNYQQIDLQQHFPKLRHSVCAVSYVADPCMDVIPLRQTVVVFPGGGYAHTSAREAEVIALSYVAKGMNAVVLYYSCKDDVSDAQFPDQLCEGCAAVALVREYAQQWNADPEQVYVCGFSAGGHLAASVGTLWHLDAVTQTLDVSAEQARPNGMLLCYPVISADPSVTHVNSFINLLGTEKDNEQLRTLTSLDLQVTEQTPPAFLWHTAEDGSVPVENSLRMATALQQKKIPYELHVYPYGRHGLSLATDFVGGGPVECQAWMDLSVAWIKRNQKK